MGQQIASVDAKKKIHINLARLKKGGDNFEIDVDPDLAVKFKQNDKSMDIREVLKAPKIFSDAKKGLLASDNKMSALFSTSDPYEVAKIIIREGDIQLTEEYREKLVADKRKQVIFMIQRNGVDPVTHMPHSLDRIERAFKEAKIHLDDRKKAEDQVKDVLEKLRPILPIKFETKEIEVTVSAEFAAKSYSVIKSFAKILKDTWNNDGSLTCRLEIPAGMAVDFFDKLNNLTHGKVESKIIGSK